MAGVSQHCVPCYTNDHFFWMVVGTVWLQEMCVVFVVSMPFTVSLFACAMIDHSGFQEYALKVHIIHCHSLATLALFRLLSTESVLVCNAAETILFFFQHISS